MFGRKWKVVFFSAAAFHPFDFSDRDAGQRIGALM